MKFPSIELDATSQEFLEDIAGVMIQSFGISETEAAGRICQAWGGRSFKFPDIIFHEAAEYWAKGIYYGCTGWWRHKDGKPCEVCGTMPYPYKGPK